MVLPGMLILKMWALGDSSQSMRAVDPDHSRKIGGLKKKRPSTQKMHHSRKIGNGAWGDRSWRDGFGEIGSRW